MMEAGIIIAVIALVACAAVGGYALGRMDEAVRVCSVRFQGAPLGVVVGGASGGGGPPPGLGDKND